MKGNYYSFRKEMYTEVFKMIDNKIEDKNKIKRKLKFMGCTNKLAEEIINDVMGV